MKHLPHSEEAELGVLNAMMFGATADAVQAMGDGKGWFFFPQNFCLYSQLVGWWEKGKPFNLELFNKWLDDLALLPSVGGVAHVAQAFTFGHGIVLLEHYLESLTEKRWLRYIITTCSEQVKRAYDNQDDVAGILSAAEAALSELVSRSPRTQKQKSIGEVVSDVLHDLSDPEKVLGISTGFPKLDALVGGLAPHAKIVIAGLISGGKSALGQCIANSVAVDRKIPTAVFTFEMDARQTTRRLIQIRSEVSTESIAKKEAGMFDVDAYSKAAREVAEAPLWVIDERLDIAGIRARCIQLRPRLVVLDYLQICPEKKQKGENRTDQLDRMSAETKQIAHSLGLTLIELSQLTEGKEGKMTTRGSRGITADSDQLWIIEGEDDENKLVNAKQITVAKQRDGARGLVPLSFVRKITKFREKK